MLSIAIKLISNPWLFECHSILGFPGWFMWTKVYFYKCLRSFKSSLKYFLSLPFLLLNKQEGTNIHKQFFFDIAQKFIFRQKQRFRVWRGEGVLACLKVLRTTPTNFSSQNKQIPISTRFCSKINSRCYLIQKLCRLQQEENDWNKKRQLEDVLWLANTTIPLHCERKRVLLMLTSTPTFKYLTRQRNFAAESEETNFSADEIYFYVHVLCRQTWVEQQLSREFLFPLNIHLKPESSFVWLLSLEEEGEPNSQIKFISKPNRFRQKHSARESSSIVCFPSV